MEKTFIEENLLYLLLGGGVLIILLIYFFWWRKKKKKQSKQSEEEKRLNEVRKCTKKPQIPCCKENGPDGNTAARRYLFNKCLDFSNKSLIILKIINKFQLYQK